MGTNKTRFPVIGATGIALLGVIIAVFAVTSFTPGGQPIGYVGQPVASNPVITSGNEKIYSIDYYRSDWSGNLHSYSITAQGAISKNDDWLGGAQAMIDAQESRIIVTSNGSSGIPFKWANLTTSQKSILDATTAANSSLTESPLLNYIRGDKSNENAATGTPDPSKYRYRSHLLGDIIHSTPVYCGIDKCGAPTVFVGANDGMLHAINADNGTERFAYIPAVVIPNLPKLAVAPYVHTYFVDGRLDVRQFTGETVLGVKQPDQTILVGTLGAGGKGLFALDVTSAAPGSETDAASKVLWEITGSNFTNLGYTYSAPTLFQLPNKTPALVVGNGYMSSSGKAVLYLINAKTGELLHEFDTNSGNATSPNGLSSPTLWDSDNDGKMDTAFAGDLDGNLWKFDLVKKTAPVRLHNAGQAITTAPGVMRHPLGGAMVTFVTGRILTSSDTTDKSTHAAYGIWDSAPAENTVLLSQTLTEADYSAVTPKIRVRKASDNSPDWSSGGHKGWKTELPIGGERVVGDGTFITGAVFQFMSTNPTVNTETKPYGENWWMQLNALTGGANNSTLFDLNGDSVFSEGDQIAGDVDPTTGTSAKIDPVGRHMGGGVRSQLIALAAAGGLDVYHSNYDKNDEKTSSSTSVVSRGVSGGHFDVELYCNPNTADVNCSTASDKTDGQAYSGNTKAATGAPPVLEFVHVHEYDDIYDKTGVDMLNPSQKLLRLSRALGGTNTTQITAGPTYTTVLLKNWTETGDKMKKDDCPTSPAEWVSKKEPKQSTYDTPQSTTMRVGTGASEKSQTVFVTVATLEYVQWTRKCGASYQQNKTWYSKILEKQEDVKEVVTVKQTLTTPLTKFKVLVANQAYSPAVQISVGGADYVKAYEFQARTGMTAADFPTYDIETIASLKFNLPVDGFKSQDWGTGVVRSGLHPTVPYVVGGLFNYAPKRGTGYEWRNGALSFLIVKSNITDADIRMNVDGAPGLGYVLKDGSYSSKMIAEYTAFWHAPKYSENDTGSNYSNGGWGMGEGNWSMTPLEDDHSDATAAFPQYGSTDPKEGTFGKVVTTGGTTVKTTVISNDDGSVTTVTETTVTNPDGSTTTTTTTSTTSSTSQGIETGGAVNASGVIDEGGEVKKAQQAGRVSWRELQK